MAHIKYDPGKKVEARPVRRGYEIDEYSRSKGFTIIKKRNLRSDKKVYVEKVNC